VSPKFSPANSFPEILDRTARLERRLALSQARRFLFIQNKPFGSLGTEDSGQMSESYSKSERSSESKTSGSMSSPPTGGGGGSPEYVDCAQCRQNLTY
jgi:hypothetical protein